MSPHLADAFASGMLVRPSAQQPDLVHLVRAIATLAGIKDLNHNESVEKLLRLIGPSEHHVFVLLDGLGMNVLERLGPDSFLRRAFKMRLCATSPSTTASALTSVATAFWPNRHGITGWFTYLPEYGLTCTVLPFTERFTQQPLAHRGITAQDILPLPAFYSRMTHEPLTLLPSPIINTAYATYSRGYTTGHGYSSIPHAIDLIIHHVAAVRKPSHVHLYIPDIDTACHKVGSDHPSVIALTQQIDAELARLAERLAGRARIIVSADHGLINVPKPDQTLLLDGDPLFDLLLAVPSGDGRMPIFHVRENCREAFVEMFNTRFGDRMALLETEEAERLQLFGPGEFSPVARRRFGDFIAVALKPVTLSYFPPNKSLDSMYVAQHAGLSPDEMHVPLCIA